MEYLFKALSEVNRLRILSLLARGEMCVCEIECSLKLLQPTASRHLNALKQSGILEKNKNAQWTYYRVSERFMEENQQLWLYLKEGLPKMPSYRDDLAAYKECKSKGNCCKTNTPH